MAETASPSSAASRTDGAARAVDLRHEAERRAAALPALLAEAERLAATVLMGAHGRRRSGPGESFWQYRRALPGDPMHRIDWRRSGRGDTLFIRETEWEAAQTAWLWCDQSLAMSYRSSPSAPEKGGRAAVLSLALAILLLRGGERVALLDSLAARPGVGDLQLNRMTHALAQTPAEADFGTPPPLGAARGGRAIFVSDFFGELEPIRNAVASAAGQGVSGLMLQVVDPAEESFPFDGRIVFESMAGAVEYETDRAGALKTAYQDALARRRADLRDIAAAAGWRFSTHRTDASAAPALLWLAEGLSASAARA